MTDLENTFGEEFAQNYKEQIAKKREQRNKVRDEDKLEIAHLAVNEGKFQEGEPRFTFQSESGVSHEVRLMQLPKMENKSIFGYVNELKTGAVTCPLDYLGDWMSCLFNDPEDLRQMEPGEHYIIIGELDQWENDKGEVNDQISPVRGVLSLPEAKKAADMYLQENGPNDKKPSSDSLEDDDESMEAEQSEPEEKKKKPSFKAKAKKDEDSEPEPEPETEDGDTDEALDELGFGGDDDNEEEEEEESSIPYEQVKNHVEELGEGEAAVWELDEGDARLKKLANVICVRMDLDKDDEEVVNEVAHLALDAIEEHNSSDGDEEDEEDALF